MALPDLIEITPLHKPVRALVSVPGSKSITNRALILAALASGTTTLKGALWSEDTQVMVKCLHTLGFDVLVSQDPEERSNRIIIVKGKGGTLPKDGDPQKPLELFVGNAGTAARFLAALVCLGKGAYRLSGVPRMHERPQAALFSALRELGYQIESPNDKLPAIFQGTGPRASTCEVSIRESSQFASALLLCSQVGMWNIRTTGENADESPYVAMTAEMLNVFPKCGGDFQVEPDASSGSYFWGAETTSPSGSQIQVANWPRSGWQVDAKFPEYLPLPRCVSRRTELGDSIMTGIVLAPLAGQVTEFTDLGRLRVQECERVAALRTELSKCGAKVEEHGDSLRIEPSTLHGAEIETYHDHRMAMCFAILGLKVPDVRIKNPACVKKTFPDFFQKLMMPAPNGLGVEILNVSTGKKLQLSDSLA